jgi:hypothetical protein
MTKNNLIILISLICTGAMLDLVANYSTKGTIYASIIFVFVSALVLLESDDF